jgi:hypothetical protein
MSMDIFFRPCISHMDPVIALCLVPPPLSWEKMISILWLEASSSNEHIAVGSVRLIRAVLLGKHLLDVMIALIAGAFNPDPFRLI